MTDVLSGEVSELLREAERSAADARTAATLAEAASRMGEPLRLAIAGKVKAGKSTLLNSLVGEELAPTDAGECTRIVTWYRWSEQPRVVIYPIGASPQTRPFSRDGHALNVDLGSFSADQIHHMDVGWPSRRLRELTLVDTPGLASLSTDLSASTLRALTAGGDEPSVADAVVYLLRHAHSSDIRFLESFHGDEIIKGTPMNAIGVLSRADEIGSARLDALTVATQVAERYHQDPRLRRLCPVVVPVGGLLAQAGATLREREYRCLAALGALPEEEITELLLTVDHFVDHETRAVPSQQERQHLLSRFGLFGLRLSISLIQRRVVADSSALAAALTQQSGITELHRVLQSQFTARSRILKARMGVAVLRRVLDAGGCHNSQLLRSNLERVEASAHEFVEVRTLNALRSGQLDLTESVYDDLETLLGGNGHDIRTRLGLSAEIPPDAVSVAARGELLRWQRLAEHPLTGRQERSAARVATRTLEGIVAAVNSGGR